MAHFGGRVLYSIVRRLPIPILIQLERASQVGQGKGWGASTVTMEVAAGLSLLPDDGARGVVAIDAGANVGNWTAALLKAQPSASILAVEPSEAANDQLSKRFAGDSRVHIEKVALGSSRGEALLWSDRPGSGLASLERRRLDHFGIDFDHSEEVSVRTLDEVVGDLGRNPSILKLDVEGREIDVLKGASRTIAEVDVIQFEFGGCNIDTRTFFQDFWHLLVPAGFGIWRLGPQGLAKVESYMEQDEAFGTTNFFAARG